MSKINDLLITEAEKYITDLLSKRLSADILFHTLDHTLIVRKYAETIGLQEGFNEDEMNLLIISALFCDSGYTGVYEQRLEESIRLATEYLKEKSIDPEAIATVSEAIRSTKIPQNPANKISAALCDAEAAYVAMENGLEMIDLLYQETALQNPALLNKRSAFEKSLIEYLTSHTYFTKYGRSVLQTGKEATIKHLSERLKWRKMTEGKKDDGDKNNIFYSRGVETMLRLTARNQINLNSIADNKSNILISVNAIIISIIITVLVGNIRNMSQDIIPVLVLLLICLVTIVIAILSTRPILLTKKFTEEDLKKKDVDLIFFGNFIKLDYDVYLSAMKEMMKDDEHLYSIMIKNQYSLGNILARKFRLVKMAYNVFMIGIIITVIVFLVNLVFTEGAV